MNRTLAGLTARVSQGWSATQRVPFANEVAVLLVLVAVLPTFKGGVSSAALVAGVVGSAPTILNAIGLVLVFRANRFINFAQVQIGLFGAVVFDGLNRGQVILHETHSLCSACVGEIPGSTARTVNFILSALAGLIVAGALSFIVYVVVVRRFAQSPVLISSIVTIFIAQALLGFQDQVTSTLVSRTDISKGLALQTTTPPVDHVTTIAGFPVHLWPLVLLVIAPMALVATATYLRRTSAGVAIRAAAENPQRAETLGVDVPAVTSRIWLLVGLLSGLAGVVQAFSGGGGDGGTTGSIGLPVGTLVVLLTVLAFARFTNLWVAGAAAVVLTVLSTSVQVAFSSQVPLDAAYVFIVGALLLLQRDTSTRASREDFSGLDVARELRPIPRELRPLPQVRRYVRSGSVALALALAITPFAFPLAKVSLVVDALGLCIVGLSLLVLTGWAGQVSLGQFGFASSGAWTAAVSGLPFPLAILLAGVAGAAAAVVVGLPALKLKGLSLAISTIAFALSARALFIDDRYLGSYLPSEIHKPNLLGLDLTDEHVTYFVTLALVVAFCFVIIGLRRSRTGRVLIALRANEATAQSFGISALKARLVAFSIAGFMAAVAGALLAFHLGRVAPAAFSPDKSLLIFLYTVLGGLGGIAGPLLGFFFYALVTIFFADNAFVQYLGAGLGAVLLMLVAPGGLAELAYRFRDNGLRRLAIRLRIPVASLMGDKGAALAADRVVLEEKREQPRRAGDLLPVTYKPEGQWALERLGHVDGPQERVGVR